MIDSFFGLVVLDRDVVVLVFRILSFGDLTELHLSIFIFFFIRNIVSVGLNLADRVQIILRFLVLVLDMSGENFGGKLVVNHLHCVRNHVILLCQSSKRRQNRIVNVLEQKHSVKGIHNRSDRTVFVLRSFSN